MIITMRVWLLPYHRKTTVFTSNILIFMGARGCGNNYEHLISRQTGSAIEISLKLVSATKNPIKLTPAAVKITSCTR